MSRALRELTRQSLVDLADALEGGSLSPPFTPLGVRHFAPKDGQHAVARELTRLSARGMQPAHVAELLRAVAQERGAATRRAAEVELVWTGPEAPGTASRDTLVVVEQLFARATRTVLLAGYSVFDGRSVFRTLIDRAKAVPALRVRMFLNIDRTRSEADAPEAQVLARFAGDFARFHWAEARAPEVFYDPRSLDPDAGAVLHAKAVIVDDEISLVTSANLTPAAQRRNIEAGVLLHDPLFAGQLRGEFERLIEAGLVRQLPGLL